MTRDCTNTILCYRLLTGRDGQKGAAKDFIDLDRYAALSDIWNYRAEQACEPGSEPPPVPVRGGRGGGARAAGGGRSRRVWW